MFSQDRMPAVIFNVAIVIKKCDLILEWLQTWHDLADIVYQPTEPPPL